MVDKTVAYDDAFLKGKTSALRGVINSVTSKVEQFDRQLGNSSSMTPKDEPAIADTLVSAVNSMLDKLTSEIGNIEQAGDSILELDVNLADIATELNLQIASEKNPIADISGIDYTNVDLKSVKIAVQGISNSIDNTLSEQNITTEDLVRPTYDRWDTEHEFPMAPSSGKPNIQNNVQEEPQLQIVTPTPTMTVKEEDTVIVEEKEKERVSNGGTFLGDTVANIQATAGTPSQLNTPQIDEEERQTYINAAATASTAGLAALSGAEVNVGNTEGPSLIEKGKEWAQGLFNVEDNHAKIEVEGEGGGSASFAEPNANSTNETITPFRPGDPAIIESDTTSPSVVASSEETTKSEEVGSEDKTSEESTISSEIQRKVEEGRNKVVQESDNKFNDDVSGKSELEEIDAITGAAPSVKPPVSNAPSYVGGGIVSPSVPDVPSVNVTPTSIDDVATPIEPVEPSEPEIPVEPTPASPEVVTPSEPEVDTPTEIETPTNDVPTTPVNPVTPEVVNPTPVVEPEKSEEVLPVDPLTPVTPSNPIKPVRPVDPVKPVKPVSPLKPSGGDKKPEEIVSPEIPVEVEPEVVTPSEPEVEVPTVEYNGTLIDETPKSENENGSALGTIGTVAGVGLALGAAAYGVNQAVTKDKDDDHYEYEKEKEQESLEDQYKEYTVNEEGLNAFGGEN